MENEYHCFTCSSCSRKQKAKFGPNFHREKELRKGSVVSSQGVSLCSKHKADYPKVNLFEIYDLETKLGTFLDPTETGFG